MAANDPLSSYIHDFNIGWLGRDYGGRGSYHREDCLMSIPIIASQISGIAEALERMGYDLIGEINWNRMPVRINGIWHAEIHHG